MRDRPGFTLVELMLVTLLLGVLATIAAESFSALKQRSMTAATRAELRNVMTAVERYRTVTGLLPSDLDDLVNGGFHRPSANVNYCTFERDDGPPADVRLEAAHRGSTRHLVARYPSWSVEMHEVIGTNDCG